MMPPRWTYGYVPNALHTTMTDLSLTLIKSIAEHGSCAVCVGVRCSTFRWQYSPEPSNAHSIRKIHCAFLHVHWSVYTAHLSMHRVWSVIHVSPPAECENLIRSMLVIDPLKRISIREIVTHQWIRSEDDPEFDELIQESLCPGTDEDQELNDAVLRHMDTLALGVEKEKIVEVCGSMPAFADFKVCGFNSLFAMTAAECA